MNKFPIYTIGKIALSFKRSYKGTLKAVMLNVIEEFLSKICDSCDALLEIQPKELNCLC